MEKIILERGKELIKLDNDFYIKAIRKINKTELRKIIKSYNIKKERQTKIEEWIK